MTLPLLPLATAGAPPGRLTARPVAPAATTPLASCMCVACTPGCAHEVPAAASAPPRGGRSSRARRGSSGARRLRPRKPRPAGASRQPERARSPKARTARSDPTPSREPLPTRTSSEAYRSACTRRPPSTTAAPHTHASRLTPPAAVPWHAASPAPPCGANLRCGWVGNEEAGVGLSRDVLPLHCAASLRCASAPRPCDLAWTLPACTPVPVRCVRYHVALRSWSCCCVSSLLAAPPESLVLHQLGFPLRAVGRVA